jgi:hypothetical protein
MPKYWIYFIALFIPLLVRIFVLNTDLVMNWLWYGGHEELYHAFNNLRAMPELDEYFGIWPLSLFTVTVFSYWMMTVHEEGHEALGGQFVMLPLAYVPFSFLYAVLSEFRFEASMLYTHPLVVIPAWYLYLFPWLVFLWAFTKLRLVVE